MPAGSPIVTASGSGGGHGCFDVDGGDAAQVAHVAPARGLELLQQDLLADDLAGRQAAGALLAAQRHDLQALGDAERAGGAAGRQLGNLFVHLAVGREVAGLHGQRRRRWRP